MKITPYSKYLIALLPFALISCKSTEIDNDTDVNTMKLNELIKSATQGNDEAQHALCFRHKYGRDDVPKDHEKAFK